MQKLITSVDINLFLCVYFEALGEKLYTEMTGKCIASYIQVSIDDLRVIQNIKKLLVMIQVKFLFI